ncbi:hypothetical protein GCM10007385_35180 [Tateyamaria omphalii]|uniref:hypothetical protein n=1 Tax=Tateyamaria omphalii TaxID=299262 RepID=UPI00167B871E|nr:hypothetical protein [Tateyamaria omphalii]GGX63016.1 hypothetical protein GCM10007385_35180 [Tateyamaria omphalii]
MERERLAVDCLTALEEQGLELLMIYEPDQAFELLESTNRDYSTLPLDPRRVAFTRTNAFWMFAMKKGEVYAGTGVRFDDLGDETFDSYYRRTSQPTYGVPMAPTGRTAQTATPIAGKTAYWGDLISPKNGSKNLNSNHIMRLFCYYGQHRVFSDFRADYSYCFMRDKQFIRGAPQTFGFLSSRPFIWEWDNCPFPGGCPEWVPFLARTDFQALSYSIKRLLVDDSTPDN